MALLRKVNLVIATVTLGYVGSLIFWDGFELPTNLIFSFVAFMFLLRGIEDAKERNEKFGYLYISTSLILFLLLLADLLNIV